MRIEQLLDLARKVFLAAAVDDLLLAARDPHIAFAVGKATEIAGEKPAVRREAVAIRRRIVEITQVNRRTDSGNLADFAVRHVVAVVVENAQTHGVDAAPDCTVDLERIVGQTREGVVARFQHSVELDQLRMRNGGLECLDRFHRGRCAAGDDDAQ